MQADLAKGGVGEANLPRQQELEPEDQFQVNLKQLRQWREQKRAQLQRMYGGRERGTKGRRQ